jgi:hypothetical protein
MPGCANNPDAFFGIYSYCLTRTPLSFPYDIVGIDNKHKVYFTEQEGLFVAVSSISLKEFNEDELDKKMTDMVWLTSMAKRHEEITEFIMIHDSTSYDKISPSCNSLQCSSVLFTKEEGIGRKGRKENDKESNGWRGIENFPGKGISENYYTPVVPLRFCTIYRNQEALFKTIIPHKKKIMDFLGYVADKAEWSVKIFCDKRVFMDSHGKKDGQSVKADQMPLLPGEGYLLTKKMKRVNEETFMIDIQKALKNIHDTLSANTDRYQFLRCTDKKIHGRPLDMIMNIAFLVEWHKFNLFKETIEAVMGEYKNEGLAFEMSGPWPPYNFCPEL